MKRHRALVFLAALVVGLSLGGAVTTTGCASVGTGDPAIVRAEDVQSNSLSFYQTAMEWHFANSKAESPSLYKAFEAFRVSFPPAYKTLTAAIPAYKSGKGGDLSAALQAVEKLTADIRAVWTPAPAGGH